MTQNIKLHRGLVEAVVLAVQQIFVENRQADKVIEFTLKSNKKWGARDRAFIAENTYEIVRWWRLLKFVSNFSDSAETTQDFWYLTGAWFVLKKYDLPSWGEFQKIDAKSIAQKYEEAQSIRKIRESMPNWLDELAEQELGDAWDAEAKALNGTASVYLRVNELKISRDDLQKKLAEAGIETHTVEGVPSALVLEKRSNVFGTPFFKEGLFEVQDAGSQMISQFLDLEPGMRVVDACAGAGGKTLHISTLMHGKGRVIALDVENWKLEELQRRAKRNGISNTEVRLIEPKTIKRLRETADRLLLDVPCSGLGVLRRNPDSKWKIKPDFLENIKKVQADILQNYSQILKKGGKMVYATCSILPSESEEQVQKFLAANANYQLLKEHRVSPAKDGFDGFYMALIEKK